MPWGPDVETNLAISSANHLKVRFIQQSHSACKSLINATIKITLLLFIIDISISFCIHIILTG
ncbi:hypothetical protein E3U36_11305 [Arsenophonus endosymbiont of Aphis craccivora]|uniref:hypothetical protein n=1 Tax=Arsenophonus endosymbiont of Aphis craccivora TaxID=1231049 RepID=UPI0015DBEDCB|nr:hypothetical protein [Arsenophonus endosymbiont of Aphis craccivora]QLK88479.1 hypothetical protein E3U36_11305 [Arsenophonus endosymbiont of Aphis craccivora]